MFDFNFSPIALDQHIVGSLLPGYNLIIGNGQLPLPALAAAFDMNECQMRRFCVRIEMYRQERTLQGTRRIESEIAEINESNKCGTPQGGVASPLLSVIYMNRFLKHWRLSGRREAFRAHVAEAEFGFSVLSFGGGPKQAGDFHLIRSKLWDAATNAPTLRETVESWRSIMARSVRRPLKQIRN